MREPLPRCVSCLQSYSLQPSASLKEISSHFSRAVTSAASPPHPCNHRLTGIIESLVHLEGHFTFDQQMAYDWCSAICHHNEELGPHRSLLFACLRIGYRRFDTIPARMTTLSPHHHRMIPLVFSSKDDGIIGDFICAWCTGPTLSGFGNLAPHAKRLVDLVHLESFGSRLQHIVFRALGRTKHTDFKHVGLPKLIALLDRIEDEAMLRAPELRDFLFDALGSPEGRNLFPLRYWRIAGELAARDRHFRSPDLPKMDLIRFLEAEGEWEKLAWWMGAIWTSVLPVGVVEDQMEDIVAFTELVVRRNPDAAAAIGNLVKISSELALGVQYAEKLKDALEDCLDQRAESHHS